MGYKIMEIRKQKKMSQAELADKSGISRQTISALESGTARNTEVKTLLSISEALGVPVSEIFYADSE